MTRAETAQTLRIEINGEPREVAAATLEELLAELGLADAVVATAVNAAFVPKDERPRHRLQPGDRVEILSPRQGG